MEKGDERLKGTRNPWLWNEEVLGDEQYAGFAESKDAELKTSRAWLIKEAVRYFWKLPGAPRPHGNISSNGIGTRSERSSNR